MYTDRDNSAVHTSIQRSGRYTAPFWPCREHHAKLDSRLQGDSKLAGLASHACVGGSKRILHGRCVHLPGHLAYVPHKHARSSSPVSQSRLPSTTVIFHTEFSCPHALSHESRLRASTAVPFQNQKEQRSPIGCLPSLHQRTPRILPHTPTRRADLPRLAVSI